MWNEIIHPLIPKLQRLDKQLHHTLYCACAYLSLLGWKIIQVSKLRSQVNAKIVKSTATNAPSDRNPTETVQHLSVILTLSRSPCTALTTGICLPSGLSKGTVTAGVWKTVGIPTDHVSPWCNGTLGNPNLYLEQPITKAWCQPIGGHVSYPTDSPIATH